MWHRVGTAEGQKCRVLGHCNGMKLEPGRGDTCDEWGVVLELALDFSNHIQ